MKGPILCFVGRRAWARPAWAARSRGPWQEVHKDEPGRHPDEARSGDTAAPTWARCPAASSRASKPPVPTTRCSCSTRSINWARTFGATLPPPPGVLDRSKTTRSATITSICLRPLQGHVHHHRNLADPIPRRSWTGWNCWNFRVTPRGEDEIAKQYCAQADEENGITGNRSPSPTTRSRPRSANTPGRPGFGTSNARSATFAARSRARSRRAQEENNDRVRRRLQISRRAPVPGRGGDGEGRGRRGHRPGLDAAAAKSSPSRPAWSRAQEPGSHRHLGDVMRESAQAGLSYAKRRMKTSSSRRFLRPPRNSHPRPGRRIPKDGPSAGVTMATAWFRP